MEILHRVAFILVIVGGLNWLLVGVAGMDIGNLFGGQDALVSKLIYILVGLSAIYLIMSHKKYCKLDTPTSTPSTPPVNPM